ncbi:hypothetical protein D0T49_00375 [Paludibacter sp. 221]|uniref:hypothetical protein n=1 Tax=Paludibacter sp. 221 TaxID=2302939 RepID=UPI0013D4E1AF|nr:hypothetical protein [Paludibacter sp. 221]NDV45508.1 hypothetical protein [Paludibacter sp. 221]
MDKRAQIVQLLSDLLKNGRGNAFFTAQVVSVEGDTCTVMVDELELTGVRLKPTTDVNKIAIGNVETGWELVETKMTIIPAIDSMVLVGSFSGDFNNLFVLQADIADEVYCRTGAMSVRMNKEGIVFNDGKLGGLVKLEELTKKINTLESDLNTLKQIFSAWVTAPGDGGAALKLAATTWALQGITQTKSSELANEKVRQ